ncbi:hypothetical protein BOH72_11205 [Mycobacterium sp. WY10]|nr:hypothetical protein BOH72_11205 [Mycobacterium sp. WY10]
MTAEIGLNAGDARELTDQIKTGVEAVWHLITRAYTERAWAALGYTSWDDYCTREFGTSRLRLPREERAEVVSSLRESGLSLRAIASATGNSVNTVRKELDQVYQSDTPAEPAAPAPTCRDCDGYGCETCIPDPPMVDEPSPEPTPITGIDGKRYPKPQPEPVVKPRRRPLTEIAADIASDMEKLRGRINRLIDDDRFTGNTEAIAGRIGRYEVWLSEAVARLHESLGGDS